MASWPSLCPAPGRRSELTGEGGLLAELTRKVLESALEGELTDHLGHELGERAEGGRENYRNGAPEQDGDYRGLLVSAPAMLREQVADLQRAELIRTLTRLLRRLARRHQAMDSEIAELDAELGPLVQQAAPALLELFGVGPETAGQLLASAKDNPERMRSEAAFAHLAGVAPIPASPGRTHHHRLNRGGDRAANNALHTIVLVRMRFDECTRTYVERRTKEGLSKKDIMRCLKRFVAREVYRPLTTTPTERIPQTDLAPAA
uniref:transposase n=1 Tax=Actinacidiphila soli TaxID=2487275 RepID=UPI001F0C4BB2|nr:transposase [Actinacidiphila soli]